MNSFCLSIDSLHPQADVIARAAEVLRAGGIVAFPTETVYGLGANALDAEAVRRIFAAKGRPSHNPLIVHVLDEAAARHLATDWPDAASQLAASFWPGPLSMVVPKRPMVPSVVTAGGPTVALRVPDHAVARALLEAAGVPIAAPSANPANRVSATSAEHVQRGLAGAIDLLLDGGPTRGGLESTVVDVTSLPVRVLRPGLISAEQLAAALGAPVVVGAVHRGDAPLPSPGMMTRHYAPQAPLQCVAGDSRQLVEQLCGGGVRTGWMPLGERSFESPLCTVQAMPAEPEQYARRLYATLHQLEEAGVQQIVVELPPDEDRWAAVRDRLLRAAAS